MKPRVQPFHHLVFPRRDAGQFVPVARAVRASGNPDEIAARAHFVKRGLEIGVFGERDVLVFVALDEEEWRRVPGDVGDGRGIFERRSFAFLVNEGIERRVHILIQGDGREAALGVERDDGLDSCAFAVYGIFRPAMLLRKPPADPPTRAIWFGLTFQLAALWRMKRMERWTS